MSMLFISTLYLFLPEVNWPCWYCQCFVRSPAVAPRICPPFVLFFNWLSVLIVSHTRFSVNLHSVVAWMSRTYLMAMGFVPTTLSFVNKHSTIKQNWFSLFVHLSVWPFSWYLILKFWKGVRNPYCIVLDKAGFIEEKICPQKWNKNMIFWIYWNLCHQFFLDLIYNLVSATLSPLPPPKL